MTSWKMKRKWIFFTLLTFAALGTLLFVLYQQNKSRSATGIAGTPQGAHVCSARDMYWAHQKFYEAAKKLFPVDCATFQILNAREANVYGKDTHAAYYFGMATSTTEPVPYLLSDVDIKSFTSIAWAPWATDSTHVYFGNEVIPGADPKTFFHVDPEGLSAAATQYYFNYYYYKDAHSVYAILPDWQHIRHIDGASPSTFTIIGTSGEFAKDSERVYNRGEIIPDIDANTFAFVGGDLYKDVRTIFRYDPKQKQLIPTLEERDAATFRAPSGNEVTPPSYTIDKNGVYFHEKPIFGADPQTFTLYKPTPRSDSYGGEMSDDKRYAHDNTAVYYEDKEVLSADPETFHPILPTGSIDEYGSDASHVFYLGQEVVGADPKTFVPLTYQVKEGCRPGPYGKDATGVYYGTHLVVGADPMTFKVDEYGSGPYGRDTNHVFENGVLRPELDPKTFSSSCNYG
jgi:hypothetical protein